MRLWFWPALIGVLTTMGLITGLVSDHSGDYFAWVGLGVPVAVGTWFSVYRRHSSNGRDARDK